MILYCFLLTGVLVGVGAGLTGLAAWQAALAGLGVFAGLNLVYVAFWYAVAATVDDTKTIERTRPICWHGCCSIAGWLCAWAGVHTQVSGLEHIPEKQRFLFVCNHRSSFDPIVTAWKLRRYNISFISKPSNLAIKGIGKLAYGAGFLPINRENDREALKTILLAADFMKKDFCSMAVYPEGTRSKTGEMLPFHAGSFKIAQKANAPVVVAAVRGTEKISGHFLKRPKRVRLDILACIPAEEVKAMSTQELSARCRALIEADLGKEAAQ